MYNKSICTSDIYIGPNKDHSCSCLILMLCDLLEIGQCTIIYNYAVIAVVECTHALTWQLHVDSIRPGTRFLVSHQHASPPWDLSPQFSLWPIYEGGIHPLVCELVDCDKEDALFCRTPSRFLFPRYTLYTSITLPTSDDAISMFSTHWPQMKICSGKFCENISPLRLEFPSQITTGWSPLDARWATTEDLFEQEPRNIASEQLTRRSTS